MLRALATALVFVTSGCIRNRATTKPNSITAPSETHGKWLATVAIGSHISSESTLAFRNLLAPVFTSETGGSYRHALDITDADETPVTKAQLLQGFERIGSEVSAWKQTHPGTRTMVVWVISGHGFFDESQGARLQVGWPVKEFLSGKELAEHLARIPADETLVFLQSCHGGGLLREGDALQQLAADLMRERTPGRGLAVVSPIHEISPTPANASLGIFDTALARLVQRAEPAMVTYADLKNELMRAACEHKRYVPRELLEPHPSLGVTYFSSSVPSGVDPQFLEAIDPALPLLLTSGGLAAWKEGRLPLPQPRPASHTIPVASDVAALCKVRLDGMLTSGEWSLSLAGHEEAFSASRDAERLGRLASSLLQRTFSSAERQKIRDRLATNVSLPSDAKAALLKRFDQERLTSPVAHDCLGGVWRTSVFCRARGTGDLSLPRERICVDVSNDHSGPLTCGLVISGKMTQPNGSYTLQELMSQKPGQAVEAGATKPICVSTSSFSHVSAAGGDWSAYQVRALCSRDEL